jgi:ArsR family transcriptional regulator
MEKLLQFARILSDETRQTMMKVLCCCELSVTEVIDKLAQEGKVLTQPTVSHHLAELKNAGLVTVRKDGRQVFYSLNQDEVSFCCGQIMLKFAPTLTQNITPNLILVNDIKE